MCSLRGQMEESKPIPSNTILLFLRVLRRLSEIQRWQSSLVNVQQTKL